VIIETKAKHPLSGGALSRKAKMNQEGSSNWRLTDGILLALLSSIALLVLRLLSMTARPGSADDPTDSPFIAVMWLGLPLLVLVACLVRPGVYKSMTWVAAAVIPPSVVLVASGTVLYDGSGGASLWPIGLVYLMAPVLWLSSLMVVIAVFMRALFSRRSRKRPSRRAG
jgi:hypothetical protein